MRTLLIVTAVAVFAAGAGRWRYNSLFAEYRRQEAIVAKLEHGGAEVIWIVHMPDFLARVLDDRLQTRAGIILFDHVPDDEITELTKLLPQLGEVQNLVLMARQIVPHARLSSAAGSSPVIESLRRSKLQQITVDASIRGAPLDSDAPIYTRDDWKMLEAALPNLVIEWSLVN